MRIAVIGAGSWGTSVALLLSDIGHDVRLWVFKEQGSDDIIEKKENVVYLPGFPFPKNLIASHDMSFCMDGAEIIVTVVPTQVYRFVLPTLLPNVKPNMIFLSASKTLPKSK